MLNGFYKTRVFNILLQSDCALNTNQIWERFYIMYSKELNIMPGKTKKASMYAAITYLATDRHIKRIDDDTHASSKYKYYVKNKELYENFKVSEIREDLLFKKRRPHCKYKTIHPPRVYICNRYLKRLHSNAIHVLYSMKTGEPRA